MASLLAADHHWPPTADVDDRSPSAAALWGTADVSPPKMSRRPPLPAQSDSPPPPAGELHPSMAAGAIIAAATDGLAETPTGGHGPDNPWEIDAILFSNSPHMKYTAAASWLSIQQLLCVD